MPLMQPEVQKILRESGLSKKGGDRSLEDRELSIIDRLNNAGLSLEETLEDMALIIKESTNESLRVRCLETVMKAHGALKETAPAAASFTIVIQDMGSTNSGNKLEAPRDPSIEGINPILIPRQLLKDLPSEKAN